MDVVAFWHSHPLVVKVLVLVTAAVVAWSLALCGRVAWQLRGSLGRLPSPQAAIEAPHFRCVWAQCRADVEGARRGSIVVLMLSFAMAALGAFPTFHGLHNNSRLSGEYCLALAAEQSIQTLASGWLAGALLYWVAGWLEWMLARRIAAWSAVMEVR